ncbi:ATP-binding protein [Aquibacillus salsiterrae]|uniref:histidine kinase n=1 Tax=Aquibacillus salsiterrae TaxID=2950439 RepID=A0A9X3WCC9_9BACI|nr:ATP-binding protein [Aquibacillus salsiterrae]MDC3416263.1 PAS domain S-box protein [Aquibacillus salsiterrae]
MAIKFIDFTQVIENSLIGIFILSKTNDVIYANKHTYDLLGYDKKETLKLSNILHPQFWETCQHTIQTVIHQEKRMEAMEQKLIKKDGSILHVETDALPYKHENSTFAQIHVRDISKRKVFEKEYVSREEEYQLISKNTSDVLLELSEEGKVKYISPSVEHVLGYQEQDFLEVDLLAFIHPSDIPNITNAINSLKEEEEPFLITYRVCSKENRYIWVEAKGKIIHRHKEKRILLGLRDNSVQMETERLLRQSEKLALIGELSAGVVHEIKNPLTSIKGFLQLMQAGTIETKDYITILNSEIERIEHIANDLLGFAKPKEEMANLSIHQVLDEVVFLLNAQSKRKNVYIYWQKKADDVEVLGDKSQLKQVFINLIKNAIEASFEDGVIDVSLEEQDSFVLIKVTDHGSGIPKHNLDKLGESFFTTKKKGTGLGLMVSYKIINNHNGRIHIESEENKGTTFIIYLPKSR